MASIDVELNERFAPHNGQLSAEVMGELQSILRLHSISPQELFYKWESYNIKMGGEDIRLELKTARDFKKDIQDVLERETRGKVQIRSADKRGTGATPRNTREAKGDMFGMMEGISPVASRVPMHMVNGNAVKRRNHFETPPAKSSKAHITSSPMEAKLSQTPRDSNSTASHVIPFPERANAGQVIETLNDHIVVPGRPAAPFIEPRIKVKANTDLSKFSYKSMAMKLSEASEILDDRIDGFLELVQTHYELEDGEFGNPASQSTNEIVAIGRIASDTGEAKLNGSSIVLETSRRTGAGVRVPLKLDGIPSYNLFPGQIVALRGHNVSGEDFTVTDIMHIPLLPQPASKIDSLDTIHDRLTDGPADSKASCQPLNILISSGPYTTDFNLDFEALNALVDHAIATAADALILLGPFLDIEHPLIASGNIPPLPSSLHVNPDTATFTDVFRALISLPLERLSRAFPSTIIILVPSVRDAVNKHVSWPQDRMIRKELGLPKNATIVTNPVMLSLNEFVVGLSSQDVLYELRREEFVSGALPVESQNLLARLSKHLIDQRHFFPLFPPTAREHLPKPSAIDGADAGDDEEDGLATGAMLDISYLALGDWQHVRPDILITPSALAPFAKVVESVLVVNPGSLSKKKGPGTFARMTVEALKVSDEDREKEKPVGHRMFERTRVDVVRI